VRASPGSLLWAGQHFPGYPLAARADPGPLPASIYEILALGAFGFTRRSEIRLGHRAAMSSQITHACGRGAVPAKRANRTSGRAICAPTEKPALPRADLAVLTVTGQAPGARADGFQSRTCLGTRRSDLPKTTRARRRGAAHVAADVVTPAAILTVVSAGRARGGRSARAG